MTREVAVLFAHYGDNPVTRRHLSLLRALNSCTIIPVHRSPDHLPWSLCLNRDRYWRHESLWAGCDCLLYQLAGAGVAPHRRYVLLEWDAYMTMPVREYYDSVWDAPAAGTNWLTPESRPDWYWFQHAGSLGEELSRHAAGISPLNGVMLSHEALATVSRSRLMARGVFCELRLGSLLRYHGIRPAPLPRAMGHNSNAMVIPGPTPGLYHPVKG